MTRKTTLLGKHVHDERVKRGMTLEQLSEELGVSTSTVSRLERGMTKGAENGTRIAAAVTKWLGITPQQAWQEFITDAETEVGK